MSVLRRLTLGAILLLLIVSVLFVCFSGVRKTYIRKRADRDFNAGEYDKATIEYLNLLRLGDEDIIILQRLGAIWTERGVPLRAIPFLKRVRDLEPTNVTARSQLALAYLQIGQPAEAGREAIAILSRDPANSDAIVVLVDTTQSRDDITVAEQQLQNFPNKSAATFHLAKASLALHEASIGTAADEIQQAIDADPKLPRPHLVMAHVYMLRKNVDRAAEELKRAAELAPMRSAERLKNAEFEAARGRLDEAKAALTDVTKHAPDYVPAWRLLAQIAISEKRYDDALSILENIFSRDAYNPEARLLQANAWLAKGDPAQGVGILDKLNSAYPNNPGVKYQLARAYLKMKNVTQAIAMLEQAIGAKPDLTEAIVLLAELNLSAGKPQPVAAAMEDLLKKHPNLVQARLVLVEAYRKLGRLDDAAALLREQIKTNSNASGAHFLLGLILRQQNKNEEARQMFEKAVELTPEDLGPIDQLVDMDIADKRYNAAMARVQQQLRTKPGSASAKLLEARIYAAQRDWGPAEIAAQKAIDLDNNFESAYNLLLSVYLAQNKLPQAIGELEAALMKKPNNPQALMSAGVIYMQMKDYAKARNAYENLIALSPNSVRGLNDLAYLYAERFNRLDEAYELAQKARTLQPADASVADTLGWIFYKRGDYQQALALVQEAAGKLSENPEVQFHLGMASYMMGQVDVARLALEKAAHSPADFPGKDEAQRRLSTVENLPAGQEPSTAELEVLLKQQPTDPILLNRLAQAYEKQGQAAKAASAYEQAFQLNSKLVNAALKLAQIYAGPLHNPNKALEFAKKARELAPNDAATTGVLGRVALQTGNFSWAFTLLQESTRKGDNSPPVLHDLALATYASGKVPEARALMQRFLSASSDPAQSNDAKRFLAMTAPEQRSPGEVAEVESVLKSDPDYVPALIAKATILLQRNDARSAAEIYLRVLEKYPDFAPAQKHLAAIYLADLQDLAKAYDLAMKARKTLPDDSELARTLAEISFKRKEFSYASQLFQESARKISLSPQDLYYLGMAQLESRQEAKGREALQRALAAGLEGPFAQDAKRRLAEQKPE